MRHLVLAFVAIAASPTPYAQGADAPRSGKPNVVVILADDLGYGDVKCLNPEGKIPTPNLDRLAAAGMTFSDASSPSGVCSPTRYGVMTGRYAWRGRLKSGVLGGLSPRLIEPGRLTVAQLLKDNGYHTACVGKWHLGMDWQLKPGGKVTELGIEPREQVSNVEYDRPIKNGPNAVGFDYYFGIAASLDMVPYVFIENDKVVANPTEDRDFPMMLGKPNRTRKGPAAPGFEAEDVLPTLTKKAVGYIGQRAKTDKPFFLYLPLASPHTPTIPAKEWRGKSGMNPYADFVMATDAAVGEVLDALKTHDLEKDTLVIFTNDNGCSPQADFTALRKLGHNPNHVFRGNKADIFEGGHRVPFLVRRPGVVPAGAKTNRLVCLTDILATCADVAGAKLPDEAGEDSVSFAGAWTDAKDAPRRESLVVQSVNGSFAVREGRWKLCRRDDEPPRQTPGGRGPADEAARKVGRRRPQHARQAAEEHHAGGDSEEVSRGAWWVCTRRAGLDPPYGVSTTREATRGVGTNWGCPYPSTPFRSVIRTTTLTFLPTPLTLSWPTAVEWCYIPHSREVPPVARAPFHTGEETPR